MSGGSWDYFYSKLEDVAQQLILSNCEYRRAMGLKLLLAADAMHDIEWVDSADMTYPAEIPAIRKFLGDNAQVLIMAELIKEAKELDNRLKKAIQGGSQKRDK